MMIYMLLFGGISFAGLGLVRFSTVAFIGQQTADTIEAEVLGLAEANRTKGFSGLQTIIQARSGNQGDSLYLLVRPDYTRIAGNLKEWPKGVRSGPERIDFMYEVGGREGAAPRPATAHIYALATGHFLLVGKDISSRQAIVERIDASMFIMVAMLLLLGGFAGVWMSRNLYLRLDTINRTSRDIMNGQFERRVPVTGRNDEIDQLAGNLNNMLEQIERLMTGMREVTDNVAHDLRSPLNRLRSRLEVTLMRPASVDDYRAALQATIEDANHLLGTFNALLSIAQVEAGSTRDSMKRVNTADVARDIADLYEALAEAEDIRFEFELDEPDGADASDDNAGHGVMVWGNRELISQALANLVDNAIKYTQSGGVVRLALHKGRFGAPMVELAVSDTGPGIPAKDRARVLNRFVRLEASRNTPGSGLGLSLVSAVARLHEGRLVLADSEVQETGKAPGLKASLCLPVIS